MDWKKMAIEAARTKEDVIRNIETYAEGASVVRAPAPTARATQRQAQLSPDPPVNPAATTTPPASSSASAVPSTHAASPPFPAFHSTQTSSSPSSPQASFTIAVSPTSSFLATLNTSPSFSFLSSQNLPLSVPSAHNPPPSAPSESLRGHALPQNLPLPGDGTLPGTRVPPGSTVQRHAAVHTLPETVPLPEGTTQTASGDISFAPPSHHGHQHRQHQQHQHHPSSYSSARRHADEGPFLSSTSLHTASSAHVSAALPPVSSAAAPAAALFTPMSSAAQQLYGDSVLHAGLASSLTAGLTSNTPGSISTVAAGPCSTMSTVAAVSSAPTFSTVAAAASYPQPGPVGPTRDCAPLAPTPFFPETPLAAGAVALHPAPLAPAAVLDTAPMPLAEAASDLETHVLEDVVLALHVFVHHKKGGTQGPTTNEQYIAYVDGLSEDQYAQLVRFVVMRLRAKWVQHQELGVTTDLLVKCVHSVFPTARPEDVVTWLRV